MEKEGGKTHLHGRANAAQRAGKHSKCSSSPRWLSGADTGAEECKGLATAVSPCLLLKRYNREEYFLFMYTVENEDVREKNK